MHFHIVVKTSLTILLVLLTSISNLAQSRTDGPDVQLPQQIGDFRSQDAARNPTALENLYSDFLVTARGEREYVGQAGERYRVTVLKTASPSAAYSFLTLPGPKDDSSSHKLSYVSGLGVVSSAGPEIKFAKGRSAVSVEAVHEADDNEATLEFARALSASIDGDAGIVPELVFHLPDWEKKYVESGPSGIRYAVTGTALQAALKSAGEDYPVLEAISFDGGTEAATGRYANGRLLVVEFTTPQYAGDSDKVINDRIAQLRNEGKLVPTSYRRVGNYSVFVFNAPDVAAADELLGTVKYEKDVRWLGRNPHENEIAIRAYTNTMTGVIVTVIKTTGLAIVACLGFGALVGGIVFLRRRARTSASEVYSDAGGMIRLELLDDVSVPPASRNLVSSGKD